MVIMQCFFHAVFYPVQYLSIFLPQDTMLSNQEDTEFCQLILMVHKGIQGIPLKCSNRIKHSSLSKRISTASPVLCHSKPSLPLVVEVDENIRVVILSAMETPVKLHHCALYSIKLALLRNTMIGNRELLLIKAALEEWKH